MLSAILAVSALVASSVPAASRDAGYGEVQIAGALQIPVTRENPAGRRCSGNLRLYSTAADREFRCVGGSWTESADSARTLAQYAQRFEPAAQNTQATPRETSAPAGPANAIPTVSDAGPSPNVYASAAVSNERKSMPPLADGLIVNLRASRPNTSNVVTLNYAGTGVKRIVQADGTDPAPGQIRQWTPKVPGNTLLVYNAAMDRWSILGPTIATTTEAQAGVDDCKIMTPAKVSQAFAAWSPLPNQATKAYGLMTTDGTAPYWTWKMILPASGVQRLDGPSATINPDRSVVNVMPPSNVTLSSAPVVVDGYDGQFLTITNVSTSSSITLPDEATVKGSNLRLGGANLTLGPRQSVMLVFSQVLGEWSRVL